MPRRKPGDWNKRKREKFKQELYELQQGKCWLCTFWFDITRLKFKWNPEGEFYRLFCWGCHR